MVSVLWRQIVLRLHGYELVESRKDNDDNSTAAKLLVARNRYNELVLIKYGTHQVMNRECMWFKQQQHQHHDHIINMIDSFACLGFKYVVLPWYQLGSVKGYVHMHGSFSRQECQRLILQLIDALSYIHGLGYVYGDLKPENVLLSESNGKLDLVLCDFGSVVKHQDMLIMYTPAYAPIEVLLGVGEGEYYVDVWGVGIILYTIMFGCVPFADEIEALTPISDGDGFFHNTKDENAKDLLNNLLSHGKRCRPQMLDIPQHTFFVSYT